jgi:Cytochrome c554 and c-prime
VRKNATSGLAADRASGWTSGLARAVSGLLLFETLTGLSVWLLPFSVPNQFVVLLHTVGGLVFLLPYVVYQLRHWQAYFRRPWSHYMVTGYVAFAAVVVNSISGLVLAEQALFGRAISYAWDSVHIVTTLALVAFVVPHILLPVIRAGRGSVEAITTVVAAQRAWGRWVLGITGAGALLIALPTALYQPVEWTNEFPEGYEVEEGRSPFAPSLATTETGGALDERSLSGSASCGSGGCHEQIYDEWSTSAHRWSSMDPAFQAIQEVMANQNGPASTRYCGGCHDPISLFSGTKNLFTEELTSLAGYNEGVSCLVCHSVRETDLQGNAAYVATQPERYIFETRESPRAKLLSDFLIRAYPSRHVEVFSKRLFKTPEYCAACHKQFIDEEVNDVGWVQLQNQYDNWRKSKWNPEGEPEKVVECRECHMPLQPSTDPAAGDDLDPYRTKNDGKHRDHRFIAANSFVPKLLELPGWPEHRDLTERWLRGEREIPEIADKWAAGPAVSIEIEAPEVVRVGEDLPIRVVIRSNKVGHDFPTGPLDIIQSWIRLEVTDEDGTVLLSSGGLDSDHFIAPGAFMFKAEPVDRYGNLVDRHNLWEMVGVRYRRALFPGFSDVANYELSCASGTAAAATNSPYCRDFSLAAPDVRELRVRASLDYRKTDQYLLNYVFGAESGLTAPVIEMAVEEVTIRVRSD